MMTQCGNSVRLRTLWCGTVLVLAAAGARLVQLQVLDRPRFASSHRRQTQADVWLPAARGPIYDRRGVLLAEDVWVPCLAVVPWADRGCLDSRSRVLERLAHALDYLRRHVPSPDYAWRPTRSDLERHLRQTPELPLWLSLNIDERTQAWIAEHQDELPGLRVLRLPMRHYPDPELAAHVLGYVRRGRLPRTEEGARWQAPRRSGERGIESRYDPALRGTPGRQRFTVDALGFPAEAGPATPPVPGREVVLTLDAVVQRAAERALDGVTGAVVVVDPATGELLAVASRPGFRLDTLDGRLSELMNDRARRPLLNRALAGEYPPGSTFKPLVLLMALSKGVVSPNEIFVCRGYTLVGNHRFDCWRGSGHGSVDAAGGITRSCNHVAISAALRLGPEELLYAAACAGFGSLPGSELAHEERRGRCLTESRWHAERRRQGDLANLAMGQGPIAVTPLRMAMFCAALANGGKVLRPTLVHGNAPSRPLRTLTVSDEAMRTVRRGMLGVVEGPGGTGRRARLPGIPMGGKTGTAEVPTATGRIHQAWMLLFAPFNYPRYAVAMVVEDGESGGRTVAPRLRQMMVEIFESEGDVASDRFVSALGDDDEQNVVEQ